MTLSHRRRYLVAVLAAIAAALSWIVATPTTATRTRQPSVGIIVQGKLEGNVQASDRVELRKSAVVTGDISTERISIEEGAYLKGKIDISGNAEKAAGN